MRNGRWRGPFFLLSAGISAAFATCFACAPFTISTSITRTCKRTSSPIPRSSRRMPAASTTRVGHVKVLMLYRCSVQVFNVVRLHTKRVYTLIGIGPLTWTPHPNTIGISSIQSVKTRRRRQGWLGQPSRTTPSWCHGLLYYTFFLPFPLACRATLA